MEIEKKKDHITVTLTKLEEALNEISSYTQYQQSEAIESLNMDSKLEDLDDLLADFQRDTLSTPFYSKFHDEFESRREVLEKQYEYIKDRFNDENDIERNNMNSDTDNPLTKQLLEQKNEGDNLIHQMKDRTNAIKENIERIEDTLDAIDEDILDQREKLYRVKGKVKESQNIVKRLEDSLKQLTKTLYQDKFIKIMIILLGIVIFCIGIMIVRIKIRQKDTLIMDDFNYFLKGEKPSYWQKIDETKIFTIYCQIDRRREGKKKRKLSIKKKEQSVEIIK